MAQLPGRCRYDPSNRVLCLQFYQFYYKVDIEIELRRSTVVMSDLLFFHHFFTSQILLKIQEISSGPEIAKKI